MDNQESLSDPMERMHEGVRLLRAKKFAAALDNFMWCFDYGTRALPSFQPVKVSFLLGYLLELGEHFPEAIRQLKSRRDLAEDLIRTGFADRDTCEEFARLNERLGEAKRNVILYKSLSGAAGPIAQVRVQLGRLIIEELLNEREYDELLSLWEPEFLVKATCRHVVGLRQLSNRYREIGGPPANVWNHVLAVCEAALVTTNESRLREIIEAVARVSDDCPELIDAIVDRAKERRLDTRLGDLIRLMEHELPEAVVARFRARR